MPEIACKASDSFCGLEVDSADLEKGGAECGTSETFIQYLVSDHMWWESEDTGKHEGKAGLNQMAANAGDMEIHSGITPWPA